MKELFAKRRWDFHQQCLKYLRFVFNDHFTIVLFIFFGFLVVQYQKLLADFPKQVWPVYVILAALSVAMLYAGRLASYLESADQVFLLPQEAALVSQVRKALVRAYLMWGSLQTFVFIILLPVFLALGWSMLAFLAFLVLMLVLKALVMVAKHKKLFDQGRLNWTYAIELEQSRKQAVLKFFALFTNVKGISGGTKRRAYLDPWLRKIPKTREHLWTNLFARAFLRSADYLALSLRLLFLSLLSVTLVSQAVIGADLAVLFNFLLLFQLLALYRHYDYQYLSQLYPVGKANKVANFKLLLRVILYSMTAIQVLVSLLVNGSVLACGIILLASLLLVELYLPYKLKKVIDEGS